MKGWNGHGAAPEDEVLGVLADLIQSEEVALANLVEASRGDAVKLAKTINDIKDKIRNRKD